MNQLPLCVDLDGTLFHTDMLHESAFGLIKAAPLSVTKLPWVLLAKGKAELKQWIAEQVDFDPSVLPAIRILSNGCERTLHLVIAWS